MNTRQIVFAILAFLSLLLFFVSFNLARSLVPGWHVSLSDHMEISPLTCVILFMSITSIYGYINSDKVPAWFFWFHAILSAAPLFYNFFVFGPVSFFNQGRFPNTLIKEYQAMQILNNLFIITQIVFLFFILIRQYQEKQEPDMRENKS